MPPQSDNLHGENARSQSPVALILIDVINDLEFPDGDRLLPHALNAAQAIAALRSECDRYDIPTLYVNDNFGKWQSDFASLIDRCCNEPVRGQPIARLLRPRSIDYFVLKPRHSGFYSTTLHLLLQHIGAKKLILCGFAANVCVYFTAADAYMRDYELHVPGDCVATADPLRTKASLAEMREVLKVDTHVSTSLDLQQMRAAQSSPSDE